MQTTFLNKTNPDLIEQEVTKALNFLLSHGFIELVTEYREDEQKLADDQRPPLPFYDVTIMGSATYRYVKIAQTKTLSESNLDVTTNRLQ